MLNDFTILYNSFYFTVATIVLFSILLFYSDYNYRRQTNIFLIISTSVLYILIFGSRDWNIGSDTYRYIYTMNKFSSLSALKLYQIRDFGIYSISVFLNTITSNKQAILYTMAILYMIPIAFAFISLKMDHTFLLFFCFVSFFFFKSMGANILKQGVAISFFLLAIVLITNNYKPHLPIIFMSVAFLFHASILIPITFFLVSKYIKKIQIPLIVYLLAIILSYLDTDLIKLLNSVPLLNKLVNYRLQSYMLSTSIGIYRTGFRADFVIFNSIFTLVGLYFYNQRHIKIFYPNYKRFLFSYILTSSVFFLMFHIPYSDRFGVLSWGFIPFLLSPFLSKHGEYKYGPLKLFAFSLLSFILLNIIYFKNQT